MQRRNEKEFQSGDEIPLAIYERFCEHTELVVMHVRM